MRDLLPAAVTGFVTGYFVHAAWPEIVSTLALLGLG